MESAASKMLLLVPIFPLIGAALVFLFTNRSTRSHSTAGWLATFAAGGAFAMVVKLFLQLGDGVEAIDAAGWTWFSVGSLTVEFALRFDHLAAVMALVITGVGTLIHLYAIGYMAEDEHRPRFFCYLNLFLFAMLLLALGDNLLVMFVGWEGVGLCSYLLIGFWYKDMPNAKAGQKAFVVNRIGDAGFLLGIFSLIMFTGTVNFEQLAPLVASIDPVWIELIALFLFVGAVGKSAQIPLYIWLPDAMAGPTPVSALIHAATMVTAGIYMVTRLSFLYVAAPNVLLVIMVIGTCTAFVAATIALVQNDIKKVLAYSTVSQLGYMFMALGAGAFSNGIYHVVTHAFFKACLFMGAGSVIIGCHHEQDMREFGGLRKKMPLTFITYFVATFAIAGFPFTSGFYSKDAILWTVFSSEGLGSQITFLGTTVSHFCWGIGLLTAFLTAFYMTRSLVLTFFGEYRGHAHPHESPWVVTVPLLVLAGLSAGFAMFFGEDMLQFLAAWTREDMLVGHDVLAKIPAYHTLEILSICVAIAGIALSWVFFSRLKEVPAKLTRALPKLYDALDNKWWVDELYEAIVIKPLRGFSAFLFSIIDRLMIDDLFVNGTAMFVDAGGEVVRRAQTGQIRTYAATMFLSVCFFVVFYLIFSIF